MKKKSTRILSVIVLMVVIVGGMMVIDKIVPIFHKDPAKPYNPNNVKEVTISLDEWIG